MYTGNEGGKDIKVVSSNIWWYFLPLFLARHLSTPTHVYFAK